MSMNVLFIGDVHFQTSNIPEVDLFLQKITELAIEKQPDLIVIAGDLLHTHERLHTTPLNKAYEFVDKMRKIALTYVLVGNHDLISNQEFLTSNHWMCGMVEWTNTVIVDTVDYLWLGDYKFVFVPYVAPGRFVEALDTCVDDWTTASCIFAHQEFAGCKMGAIVSIDGDKWPLTNPPVVSGHIHSRQIVQENVYYPGAAMQHAFGESEKNVIPILRFHESGYDLEEINLDLPRKKIVYMSVDDVDTYVPPDTDDKIKVTVSGEYEDFKALKKTARYKKLVEDGVKVVFKTTRAEKKLKGGELEAQLGEHEDFQDILSELVTKKSDPFLYQSYQLVVHGKDVRLEDVMFL
jgi:DNA repair exonuclease SbcCD nuclease subunit